MANVLHKEQMHHGHLPRRSSSAVQSLVVIVNIRSGHEKLLQDERDTVLMVIND